MLNIPLLLAYRDVPSRALPGDTRNADESGIRLGLQVRYFVRPFHREAHEMCTSFLRVPP
jgi:hypothetical protein